MNRRSLLGLVGSALLAATGDGIGEGQTPDGEGIDMDGIGGTDTYHLSADLGPITLTLDRHDCDDGSVRWALDGELNATVRVGEGER